MKRTWVGGYLVLLGSAAPVDAEPVALVGATIVDGNGGKPVEDGVVMFDGDRIVAVGTRAAVNIPRAAGLMVCLGRERTSSRTSATGGKRTLSRTCFGGVLPA
jgi:hypothetical protein